VKTACNALTEDQLRQHFVNLSSTGDGGDERLFVITPDAEQPEVVERMSDRRVVWFDFHALDNAISAAITDPASDVSEHARFLSREFQGLMIEDGLIDNDDVVVVAARFAYPEYFQRHAYICQAGRSFRGGLTHLGFYTEGAIQPYLPRILYQEDGVAHSTEEVAARRAGSEFDVAIADVIEGALCDGVREDGQSYQVLLLSAPDSADTVHLPSLIVNDTISETGKPFARTMGQRYVRLAALTRAGITATSHLNVTGH
jgi:hypothetical protein